MFSGGGGGDDSGGGGGGGSSGGGGCGQKHSSLVSFQGVQANDKAFLTHFSAKNFHTVQHVLTIADVCMRVYRPE